ncbi:MAG: prevent-host-death protein [Bacteroidota bacterium]
MPPISLDDARRRLDELLTEADRGETVVISRGDGASYQIVPVPAQRPHPRFGSAKGEVQVRDDFDDPIPGIEPYEA